MQYPSEIYNTLVIWHPIELTNGLPGLLILCIISSKLNFGVPGSFNLTVSEVSFRIICFSLNRSIALLISLLRATAGSLESFL